MKTYQVAHILVQHGFEAEDLKKKLAEGASFESLAQKFSRCPSASRGGDLGVLRLGQADSDFEEAALDTPIGDIHPRTIRTRFGHHLIKRMG
jgi:peptidyl-prolyl cis-trans isomerase C